MSRTGISYSEVSIPLRYGTTFTLKLLFFTVGSIVSIPLRYGTTEVYEVPRVGESMIVSIPLRYGTTENRTNILS